MQHLPFQGLHSISSSLCECVAVCHVYSTSVWLSSRDTGSMSSGTRLIMAAKDHRRLVCPSRGLILQFGAIRLVRQTLPTLA